MSEGGAIGGVMPAEPAGPPRPDSVWEAWAASWSHGAAFGNARSALAALLRQRRVPRIWLPAYVCESIAQAAPVADETRFYAVAMTLEPDIAALARGAGDGEAVLIVDHFGRALPVWRQLAEIRPDLLLIEDRAQALDTDAPPLGEVTLFSPRKLLGVADGGLLFARLPLLEPSAPADDGLWAAQDGRALDPDGQTPERWRPLFQAAEDGMRVSGAAATARTLQVLRAAPLQPIAEARRANWRQLAEALADWALWPEVLDPNFAPLAFPILTADAAAAQARLAEARIWAPRHWASLPSDATRFPDAARLAAACVSLPLDQRYGAADMDRIVETVRGGVAPYPR